jgi:glycosyltransferase involved in cell wall biosynthesis
MTGAPVRILMTVDAVGGVWQYATELARALQPLGVDTVLAVLGPNCSEDQWQDVQRIGGMQLIETGLPLDWLSDAGSTRQAAVTLSGIARREHVDLVHLNSPALAASHVWPVPIVAVAHGCLATWWDAARGDQPLDETFTWHRDMMAKGLRASDRVIAPTASFADVLCRVFGLNGVPLVVHNGRTPPGARTDVPGIDEALTAGRLWDEVKNVRTLDAAAAALSVPFRAAGHITAPHGETARVEHLELLGPLDDIALAAKMQARPVFVSAATFEPFGLAVLEAAAAGCPLVLSDIPTFRELWNGAATFVPASDAPGFAAAINEILLSDEQRAAMGRAARERALAYTPERMATAMAGIYRDVLAERLAA